MKCENPHHSPTVTLFGNTASYRITRNDVVTLLCARCAMTAFEQQMSGTVMVVHKLKMKNRRGFDYSSGE